MGYGLAWAAEGADSRDELFGRGAPSASARNSGQEAAIRNVEAAYLGAPAPPGDPHFRKGALDALLEGSGLYSDEASTRRPCVKSEVSWLGKGNAPAALSERERLSQAGYKWLGRWRAHMLRSTSEAESPRKALPPR